ncbi:hypothetical protein [Actinobacillus vicugnae]|uniref:hypothetical protein n=1 Tax=Actinobacillus vicugnae TaxID=2573093 RepID=UPI00124061BC|nr:hypothetical protein [Actinobacillus vicugnae]
MKSSTIELAFSVLYHYLKVAFERQNLLLPDFPISSQEIDKSLLEKAEKMALGRMPEDNGNSLNLLSLFEGIENNNNPKQFYYEFSSLSPQSIFPQSQNPTKRVVEHLQDFIKEINKNRKLKGNYKISIELDNVNFSSIQQELLALHLK